MEGNVTKFEKKIVEMASEIITIWCLDCSDLF